MIRFFRRSNVGWLGNTPTKFVTDSFDKKYILPGTKVLDIGSGFGRNANWLSSKGVLVDAININKSEIRIAEKSAKKLHVRVKYLHGDATALPYGDNEFDSVLDLGCSHMLTKDRQIIAKKETARVLKSGGCLLYFGFSKKHPVYRYKIGSCQFRDLNDIKEIYGKDFDILNSEEISWEPNPAEKANFSKHVGLNVVMRRK